MNADGSGSKSTNRESTCFKLKVMSFVSPMHTNRRPSHFKSVAMGKSISILGPWSPSLKSDSMMSRHESCLMAYQETLA